MSNSNVLKNAFGEIKIMNALNTQIFNCAALVVRQERKIETCQVFET